MLQNADISTKIESISVSTVPPGPPVLKGSGLASPCSPGPSWASSSLQLGMLQLLLFPIC